MSSNWLEVTATPFTMIAAAKERKRTLDGAKTAGLNNSLSEKPESIKELRVVVWQSFMWGARLRFEFRPDSACLSYVVGVSTPQNHSSSITMSIPVTLANWT